MDIPGLGRLKKDPGLDTYISEEIPLRVLGGQLCRVVVQGYDEDKGKVDFHDAISNLLAIDQSVLATVEGHVFQYYLDCNENRSPEDEEYLAIADPKNVWEHVQLGRELLVARRPYGDNGIYISLECNCDWEIEHGLQIVFKNGLRVNKVGPYDGHFTNSDAYDDESLEDVIYPQA